MSTCMVPGSYDTRTSWAEHNTSEPPSPWPWALVWSSVLFTAFQKKRLWRLALSSTDLIIEPQCAGLKLQDLGVGQNLVRKIWTVPYNLPTCVAAVSPSFTYFDPGPDPFKPRFGKGHDDVNQIHWLKLPMKGLKIAYNYPSKALKRPSLSLLDNFQLSPEWQVHWTYNQEGPHTLQKWDPDRSSISLQLAYDIIWPYDPQNRVDKVG